MTAGWVGLHLAEMRRRNRRQGTIDQRRRALSRLARHVDPLDLADVTYPILEDYVFDLERGLAAESQATEISHISTFYKWAVDTELLAIDPTARLRRPCIPKRLPKPMAEGDLAVAIDLAPERIRPWLLLGAYAGLRCFEISQLRADDLWWDANPPLIIIADSKGGDSTSVPLGDDLALQLRACDLPTRGWLFPRLDGRTGRTMPWRISQLSNQYLRSVGITATMHQTRHRYGTELLKAADGNVRTAQEGLRHASIVSTQRYTFIAPSAVAAAVNRIPRVTTHPKLPFT